MGNPLVAVDEWVIQRKAEAEALSQPAIAMTGDVYVRSADSPRQVTWNVLLGQA